jgi:TatA/E family protein of Tat protein translocase
MFHNPLVDAIVVLIVVLLFVGPKRLPMLSRSVGESIKEFKGGVAHDDSTEKSPELNAAPEAPRESAESPSESKTSV